MAEGKSSENFPTNQLTDEEYERAKFHFQKLGFKSVVGTITHPLTMAKTLFQLGYEPYALSVGRAYIVTGRNVYYLPNIFQYLRNIVRDFGGKTLFYGVEAAMLSNVVGSSASFAAILYMDRFYPEIGGAPNNLKKSESEMDNWESARVKIRQGVRDTIAHTFGVIASRPFTVIMVREIAQLIGGEQKYQNVITSIFRIGDEEGCSGFFAGLIPNLIADYVTIWGITAIRYTTERLLEHARKEYKKDKNKEYKTDVDESTKQVRHALEYGIPLLVNSFSYPFSVISTMMAIGGSGLAISLLPYAPTFPHWEDAYNYLKPHGLTRGSRIFLRMQKGAIAVGPDHHLYASNKHYI